MLDKIKVYVIALVVILVMSVASYQVGYWNHKPSTEIKTEIQVVEKIVEKKVYIKDNTKTDVVETKPDGTVIQTTTQTDVTVATDETQIDTKTDIKQEVKQTTVELPKYAVGVMGESKVQWPLTPSLEVSGGYRVTGPFWIEGSYNHSQKSAGVGIRWEIK